MKNILKKINWTNTLFLAITPVVAIVGLAYIVGHNAIHWQTVLLAVLFTFATGMSITVGYHRLFSHKTYKASLPVRLFLALFGAAAFEGSILEWCTDHRDHHLYTDTDKDPYNAKRGFWYSHLGWLITLDTDKRHFNNVDDLKQDPIVAFQHKHYTLLAILMGIALPTAIAAIWGDWLGGFVIAAAARITFNQHATFCINSISHIFGSQTYSDRNTARDNWLTSLVTYGEGYHNYHHKFPNDYRNGVRAYHFDPSKWTIFMLSKLGQTSDLKRMDETKIIRYRVRMDEIRMQKKLEKCSQSALLDLNTIIEPAKDAIHQALVKLEAMEKSYKQLKRERLDCLSEKVNEITKNIKDYKIDLKHARRELKRSLIAWSNAVAFTSSYQVA